MLTKKLVSGNEVTKTAQEMQWIFTDQELAN